MTYKFIMMDSHSYVLNNGTGDLVNFHCSITKITKE